MTFDWAAQLREVTAQGKAIGRMELRAELMDYFIARGQHAIAGEIGGFGPDGVKPKPRALDRQESLS